MRKRQTIEEFDRRFPSCRWTKSAQAERAAGVKRCRKCGETKPVEEFYLFLTPQKAKRFASYCRPCSNSYKPNTTTEQRAEKARRSYYKHHEENKARARAAWYANHEENKARQRKTYAERKAENEAEILAQDECDICGKPGASYFYRCINAGDAKKNDEFAFWLVLHHVCQFEAKDARLIPWTSRIRKKEVLR